MPFHPFQGAIGLDIGDRALKIVEIIDTGNPIKKEYKLEFFGNVQVPPDTIEKGEIINAERAIKVLRQLIEKALESGASRWVVASLPENRTFLKYIPYDGDHLPNETEIKKLAAEHLPVDIDASYIDAQFIPAHQDLNRAGIVIGATEKRIADSFTYFLEIAGLTPIAFELESVAVARAVIAARQEEKPMAQGVLDIGASRTSFVIYDHESVQISQALPFCGENLTALFAQAFQLDLKSADQKKKEDGIMLKTRELLKIRMINREFERFAKEVGEIIKYYESNLSYARKVEEIILCGGGSNLKGLPEFLSSRLKRKVSSGNPWQNLFTQTPAPFSLQDLNSYATAIGLGLRAVYNPLRRDDNI